VAASDRFPVATVAIERAVRLVSTARLRDPVLRALVDVSLLDDLAEIEGATSFRWRSNPLPPTFSRAAGRMRIS
jgi:hypothetical protein